jgi:hypothetical protein
LSEFRGVRQIEARREESGSIPLRVDVGDDGSFEFVALPGRYSLALVSVSAVPTPDLSVSVPPTPIVDIQVNTPRIVPVTVRTIVEGGSPPQPYVLRVEGTVEAGNIRTPAQAGTKTATLIGFEASIVPGADGLARIFLFEGSYRFGVELSKGNVPPGRLRSIEAGGLNPVKTPLNLRDNDGAEIVVRFEAP